MSTIMGTAVMSVLQREAKPTWSGGAVIETSNHDLASKIAAEVDPTRPELVEVIEEALESFDTHEVDGRSHNAANDPEEFIEKIVAEIERVGESKPGILKGWFLKLFGK